MHEPLLGRGDGNIRRPKILVRASNLLKVLLHMLQLYELLAVTRSPTFVYL